jgi:ABC-type transporter MlaC component
MRRFAFLFVALLVAFSAQAAPGPAGAENPVDRTTALIEAFKAVESPAKGEKATAAEAAANRPRFEALDGFFDYDAIVNGAIVGREASFSADQLKRYRASFRDVIRAVGYPGGGRFFKRAAFTVRGGADKEGLGETVIDASIADEDFTVAVLFRWKKIGDHLRVTDVAFDGDSLVLDYRNQFGRILDKEGAAGLVQRLEKRLAEETSAQPGM